MADILLEAFLIEGSDSDNDFNTDHIIQGSDSGEDTDYFATKCAGVQVISTELITGATAKPGNLAYLAIQNAASTTAQNTKAFWMAR